MKALSAAFVFLLPLTLLAGEVTPGDSLDTVRNTLGAPRGELHLGGRDVLYYDRGEVELRSGLVTRVALRSEEAQAKIEAKRVADDLRIREMLATRQAQLIIEGEALKARQLADPSFLSAPLSYQVAFWRNFSARYTGVSCVEQLNLAQAKYYEQEASERRAAERAQYYAELEAKAREERERTTYYPVYDTGYNYHTRYTRSYRRSHYYDRDSRDCYDSTPSSHRHAPGGVTQPASPTDATIAPPGTAEGWLGVPRFVPLNPKI